MLKEQKRRSLAAVFMTVLLLLSMGTVLHADEEELSDDNSLSSLGILTEDITISPDFSYDIWSYDVVVPAYSTELELEPVTSNANATISDISGTTLDENGNGTVVITVVSESGNPIQYVLNVTREEEVRDPAQAISENEAALVETPPASAEPQTEDPRYVKVDKNSLQEAENTIERLQKEMEVYKERNNLFTYVIYGLIAVSVVLLFIVINLLLRRRDISRELKEYRKMGAVQGGGAGRGEAPASQRIPEEERWPDDDDDWDDWAEEAREKKGRKKKGRQNRGEEAAAEREEAVNVQTSWTETQVGTPAEPSRRYSGSAGRGRGSDAPARGENAGRNQAPSERNQTASRSASRSKGSGKVSDNTRMYRASSGQNQSAHRVPGDQTRMIRPVSRTDVKEDEARRVVQEEMRRVQEGRRAEAERQKAEEKVLEQTSEREKAAQEAAIRAEEAARAAQKTAESAGAAPSEAPDRKDVQIDLIDL